MGSRRNFSIGNKLSTNSFHLWGVNNNKKKKNIVTRTQHRVVMMEHCMRLPSIEPCLLGRQLHQLYYTTPTLCHFLIFGGGGGGWVCFLCKNWRCDATGFACVYMCAVSSFWFSYFQEWYSSIQFFFFGTQTCSTAQHKPQLKQLSKQMKTTTNTDRLPHWETQLSQDGAGRHFFDRLRSLRDEFLDIFLKENARKKKREKKKENYSL